MAVVSKPKPTFSNQGGQGQGQGQQGGKPGGASGARGASPEDETTVLIIDAPTGFYKAESWNGAVQEVLRQSRAARVSDMLYSHSHTDHIGNAHLVKEKYPDVKIHASIPTCDRLRKQKDSRRPIPDNCYNGNFSLSDFGIDVHDIGDAHELGNRAIYHKQAPRKPLQSCLLPVFPQQSTRRSLSLDPR
jgi:hypothetical protein